MRVDLFNSAAAQIAGESNAQPASAGNSSAVSPSGTEDRTTLSSGSTAVSSLVSQAMNSPAIRQDKVQGLQQAVAQGKYQLDPQQIATAMINEHS